MDAESALAVRSKRGRTTFIDVRGTGAYKAAHIPGAISVPAALCPHKRLPPLGRVIVYGDGLDVATVTAAIDALNAKPGIEAEMLDGGFSRWEALGYPTTRSGGIARENLPHIIYQKLVRIAGDNQELVLVDLRERESGRGNDALTDLGELFPGKPVVADALAATQGKRAAHSEIYVLIDSSDGRAEAHARTLRAAGIRRVVILTGGEEILKRRGQSEIHTR